MPLRSESINEELGILSTSPEEPFPVLREFGEGQILLCLQSPKHTLLVSCLTIRVIYSSKRKSSTKLARCVRQLSSINLKSSSIAKKLQ
ncbi:hypothetical protein TNCV_1503511 [Trichonephila clavipes]|uniref:Uncharacterized protein n=1 Tax=Trichonephila clavipes TaxID=2585209 RepID=A0A8X6RYH3_TRICX|nr:hypothetical protein TNCV_1503511 [Trichonephila clavipes]